MKSNYQYPIHLCIIMFLIFTSCNKDKTENDITTSQKIFTGSLINPSPEELQSFYNSNFQIITGDVEFTNMINTTDLVDLSNVIEIQGNLHLINNVNLISLEGLESIEAIGGDLILSDNNSLKNVNGLQNLSTIAGKLEFIDLENLENLDGLISLLKVGNRFSLYNLVNLESIEGLAKLKSIGKNLGINNHSNFIYSKIASLDGLQSLSFVGSNIEINNNASLNDFCALKTLLSHDGFQGEFYVSGNYYNPTLEQIAYGECHGEAQIILDGLYIQGSGTAISDFFSEGKMKTAINEVTQENRPQLHELYIAIKGGTEGFNIIKIDGNNRNTYGPGNDFAQVAEEDLEDEEPRFGLYRGSIKESFAPFQVSEDGLYHIAYDTEIGIVTIAKVEWGIIGAASPGGWAESTQLPSTFDLNQMLFIGTEIPLSEADYKFRYSQGWKVILDPDFDLGDGQTGIKIYSRLGGTIDHLTPDGDNIHCYEAGIYTIRMIWSLEDGLSASLEKTSDPITDYSNTELGFIGDGIIFNGAQHDWNSTLYDRIPITDIPNNFTWIYDTIKVTSQGAFKITQGSHWDGLIIGYPEVCLGGNAADDFHGDASENFIAYKDGTYQFELTLEAINQSYQLNINAIN